MPDLIHYPGKISDTVYEILKDHPQRARVIERAKSLAYDRRQLDPTQDTKIHATDVLLAIVLTDNESRPEKKRPWANFQYALGGALLGAALSTALGFYGCGVAVSLLFGVLLLLVGILGLLLCLDAKKREDSASESA